MKREDMKFCNYVINVFLGNLSVRKVIFKNVWENNIIERKNHTCD